jgi:rhamnosyltransferase
VSHVSTNTQNLSRRPTATIIVLTKNESANIGRCIGSIKEQEFDGSVEVLQIDSGSTDNTVEIVKDHVDRLVEIPAAEFHHARTRNFGAHLANGEFFVYLGGDAIPCSRTWLANLIRHFEDPTVGAVYGRQIPKPGASIERRMMFAHQYPSMSHSKSAEGAERGSPNKEYQFSTVNCAIRATVWQATPFPEFCKTYEDVAMAKQILEQGWKIRYEPESAVLHSHNYTLVQGFKRCFDSGVMYRRMGLWNPHSQSAFRGDGTRRAISELQMAIQGGEWLGAAYLALYDVGKYLGVVLGRNEKVIPLFLKKKLTYARLFD